MTTIRERVELPDSAVQPLVHPRDLPSARRTFAISWWLDQLAQPNVFFALAVVLWTISGNYVTPILAPAVITVCAALASQYYSREAWGYVPRSRQDHQRELPLHWSISQAAIPPAAMLLGLGLLLGWIIERDFPAEVGAYTAGTVIGIVGIMAVTTAWNVAVPARLQTEPGGRLPLLSTGLVIALAGAFAGSWMPQTAQVESWQASHVVLGAVIIVGVQVCCSLFGLLPRTSAQ